MQEAVLVSLPAFRFFNFAFLVLNLLGPSVSAVGFGALRLYPP
jgi:hypothetical protein